MLQKLGSRSLQSDSDPGWVLQRFDQLFLFSILSLDRGVECETGEFPCPSLQFFSVDLPLINLSSVSHSKKSVSQPHTSSQVNPKVSGQLFDHLHPHPPPRSLLSCFFPTVALQASQEGEMGRAVVLACLSVVLSALAPATDALGFTCNSPPETTCRALVGYISPNTTTFRSIQTLFGVKHLRSLLAANDRSPTLSPNTTVRAQETVFIPFTCRCSNGTGTSDRSPVYTVQKDDGLYYIASSVFSYLVVYQDIQLVNGIENANLIEVGQKLWIPLPCSCDEVDGNKAVHYAHVVAEGSTVEQIAEDFRVSEKTLMDLNGLASAKELMADKALDVPLKACASKIHNDSLDADLLVPNGAYALTANNCVRCSCGSANNWTLLCQPSEFASSSGSTCPSMQCSGAHDLYIGNTTGTSCSSTTCSYAGYTSQNTILTTLDNESSCAALPPSPDGSSHAAKIDMGAFGRNFLVTAMSILLSVQRI